MQRRELYVKLVVLLFVLGSAIWFVYRFDILRGFNIEALKGYINFHGNLAALIYIAVFSLRTLLVFFPCSVIVILGGNIFGPLLGFLYSMVSIFISASIAFFISRYFGKSFVNKIMGDKAKKLDLKVEQHGFKIFFFMRISMLFPYDVMNFAAGLTRARYRDFILGTILGIAPETFSLNYLGHSVGNMESWNIAAAVLLVAVTVVIPLVYNKVRKEKSP